MDAKITRYSKSFIDGELAKITDPTLADAEEKFRFSNAQKKSELVVDKMTRLGFFRRPKPGTAFGFVDSVFVPPSIAAGLHEGAWVAVLAEEGRKGWRAVRLATAEQYISWHRQEMVEKLHKEMIEEAEYARSDLRRDLEYFEKLQKKILDALGLHLVELVEQVDSSNYGGRGSDTYTFEEFVSPEMAESVLDTIHGRYAEPDNDAPYDHGSDRVSILANGFINRWHGPWTD